MADSGVIEGGKLREVLREEARLDPRGNFDFLRGAVLGVEALLLGAALGFDSLGDFIEAHEREEVSVWVAEAAEDASPDGAGGIVRGIGMFAIVRQDAYAMLEALEARRAGEIYAAGAPFAEFGGDVFGDESNVGVAADEFVVGGIGVGSGKGEIGLTVGRCDDGPAAIRLGASVVDKPEAELVYVEIHAAVKISDEDGDGLEAQKGGVAGKIGHGVIISLYARGSVARRLIGTG